MDSHLRQEVHNYFPNGGKAFEELANDWRLHSEAWRPTVPATRRLPLLHRAGGRR
ncbi:hypothetical protein CBM2589_U10248 [Cupriavidus taiwanensis]|uniref:Uncharacterized protein n=1 Tax=Cupriavidus taiwanensis TaxID=164546 RepID=A0A375CQQ8_9BURK|nr:hypothetical protein CBM2589_U10248 [Cupriavidus taiwanensis]